MEFHNQNIVKRTYQSIIWGVKKYLKISLLGEKGLVCTM